ncbi:DoxX family protein [Chryseobacterium sp. W4I1]|uniref:DoxX family protein n=1 Tax=Chryseobacterium sp. W4I1 TaxID=3042293 RepID=UPI0027804DE5|nr:DoxX family protein [Chryseobacterium sp. W4I1]MDQ0781597.1 putative membrane protein YphA (DoxX/SURF4 family) [Chryseobacterium sp. W4I1]
MKISFKTVLYWLCYTGYLYIIFPSAISKIIQKPQMMGSMQSLGFNQSWTIAIGIAETIGVLIVLAGLFRPKFRTLGILVLFPFAIGAFTTHMAHQEYHHYYKSLAMCFLSAILLFMDNRITINLSGNGK